MEKNIKKFVDNSINFISSDKKDTNFENATN